MSGSDFFEGGVALLSKHWKQVLALPLAAILIFTDWWQPVVNWYIQDKADLPPPDVIAA